MTSNLIYNERTRLAMDKWGTHWFKFDETSGNVTDSKGSAIGTISGATRVQGWNGEGSAISFDGNDYVDLSTSVTYPKSNFSIKFKFKHTNTTMKRLVTSMTLSPNTGFHISTNANGGITCQIYNNGNAVATVTNSVKYNDNTWHTLLFSYSNSKMSVYVDEKLIGTAQNNRTDIYYHTFLCIGSDTGRWVEGMLVGQIDDLQIYNKALTPEDFYFNKTLILHDGEYKRFNEKVESQNLTFPHVAMTSNTAPAPYVASASSAYDSSFVAYWAMDGKDTVVGGGSTAWVSATGTTTGYLQLDLGTQQKVTGFYLSPRNYSGDGIYNVPKDFVLQGSNNGSEFVDIKTFTNQTDWVLGNKKLFLLDSFADYRYFRLKINSITGGGAYTYIAIGHFSLISQIEGTPSKFHSISTNIPTQQQFLAEGMDSLSPLLDRKVETLEPLPMTDKSEILQTSETGKLFSKTIDLEKYLDIRNIKRKHKGAVTIE